MNRLEEAVRVIEEAAEEGAVVAVEALNTPSWRSPRQTLTSLPLMPSSTRWILSRKPSRQARHSARALRHLLWLRLHPMVTRPRRATIVS